MRPEFYEWLTDFCICSQEGRRVRLCFSKIHHTWDCRALFSDLFWLVSKLNCTKTVYPPVWYLGIFLWWDFGCEIRSCKALLKIRRFLDFKIAKFSPLGNWTASSDDKSGFIELRLGLKNRWDLFFDFFEIFLKCSRI